MSALQTNVDSPQDAEIARSNDGRGQWSRVEMARGINNTGTRTLRDCRTGDNTAGYGGIYSDIDGSSSLTGNTEVRGNSADFGGGIFVDVRAAVANDAGCQVTANRAPDGQGGGIYRDLLAMTVTLANDQIVTANSGGNCASNGPAIDNCDG